MLQRVSGEELDQVPVMFVRERFALEHGIAQRFPDRLVEHPRRILRGAGLVREEPRHLIRRHGLQPVSRTVEPQLAAELEKATIGEAELEELADRARVEPLQGQRRRRDGDLLLGRGFGRRRFRFHLAGLALLPHRGGQ